ncbi:MAG: hypothetical protein KF681_14740 [Bdellovibrionaceae bacterium]|nr:hypothetical protein [Pseudobdellovibrionaceae bacterium]
MAADDESKEPKISEALKKLFAAGVSGALMSEEVIRTYLADVKLPKEMLQLVIQGAQKSKDEITGRVSKEIVGLIDKIDIVKEVSKFAETHKFKINAEIEIIKKDDKPKT